ncbi:MAG: helix-turn-helix domain-containing protein [Deltaproteobacteria bacterium]|nr:helix-turn-helix domain-containing protein [Deltaproteobacteria bacterium]
MPPRKPDPKADALRHQGCLHPHPEKVSDELFRSTEFFDPRDLLQVKYEMLRRVRVDGHTVSQAAAGFGLSRPSFYRTQRVYEEGGLPALLPRKPGPRRAHKLSEKVVEALRDTLDQEPDSDAATLAAWVKQRFGISIHPRSIERALARQEKKRQP